MRRLVMEAEGEVIRVVSEDGVDVYSTHSNVYKKEERVSLLKLSKGNIHLCMMKVWIKKKKRGKKLQPGVWEYKIELSHDDKNRIEQQASAHSTTKRPEFGWIRDRVPNKVRLETVSHVNGQTDKDNENMEGKAPKVASESLGWPHCGR